MMPLPASATETGPLWYGGPDRAEVQALDEGGELGGLLGDLVGELLVLLGQGGGLAGGVVDALIDLTGQLPLLVLGRSQLEELGPGLAAAAARASWAASSAATRWAERSSSAARSWSITSSWRLDWVPSRASRSAVSLMSAVS